LDPKEYTSPFQQRKDSKKLPAKLQPRALEGWLRPEDRGQTEEEEDELEIRVGSSAFVAMKWGLGGCWGEVA
jgi:ghrelin